MKSRYRGFIVASLAQPALYGGPFARVKRPLGQSQAVWLRREDIRQDVQRDLALELRIGGLIDLPHAPLADEGGHVVMPEAGTDG